MRRQPCVPLPSRNTYHYDTVLINTPVEKKDLMQIRIRFSTNWETFLNLYQTSAASSSKTGIRREAMRRCRSWQATALYSYVYVCSSGTSTTGAEYLLYTNRILTRA
jgi:hypothetical protein